jgi:hypothetical protein
VSKAIWWGLAGLLIGLPLGAVWGGAMGAVAGTVIGAVAGAWTPVRKACARRPCKGCAVMCEPRSGPGRGVTVALVTVAGAGLAVKLLAPVAGALPAVTVTILAACVIGTEIVRRLFLYGRQLRPARTVPARVVPRAAITAGRRAIEAPPAVTVTAAVLEDERSHHAR